MKNFYSLVIILVALYVCYTYIYKKAGKCYQCEIRKDKILKTFGIKSECRKKYENIPNAPIFNGIPLDSIMQYIKPSFEQFAENGGCLESDERYINPNNPNKNKWYENF